MAEQTISYEQHHKSLPEDRRAEVERVWNVVRQSVPAHDAEEYTESCQRMRRESQAVRKKSSKKAARKASKRRA